jgi:hypothetical protein
MRHWHLKYRGAVCRAIRTEPPAEHESVECTLPHDSPHWTAYWRARR